MRYLAAAVPWPYPDDGAVAFLRDNTLPSVARGEEWGWSLRRREDPAHLIGAISLMTKPDHNRGFWLGQAWQGRGYMTEAGTEVTAFWFDTLGQARLRAPKAVANVASRRLSEREGMRIVWTGEQDFVSGPQPAEIWELDAVEWRRRRNR